MATKAERDALRADAQRKAGMAVTPAAEAAEVQAVETAQANDLDDPKTQAAIELPKTIPLVLRLSGVDRLASVSTEFTHQEVFDWELFEDLQSFAVLVEGERRAARVQADDEALAASMTTARVRTFARTILSKIARYDTPWTTEDDRGREIRHVRPTVDEIREGLCDQSGIPNVNAWRAWGLILYGMFNEEVQRRKNARAAAVPH